VQWRELSRAVLDEDFDESSFADESPWDNSAHRPSRGRLIKRDAIHGRSQFTQLPLFGERDAAYRSRRVSVI